MLAGRCLTSRRCFTTTRSLLGSTCTHFKSFAIVNVPSVNPRANAHTCSSAWCAKRWITYCVKCTRAKGAFIALRTLIPRILRASSSPGPRRSSVRFWATVPPTCSNISVSPRWGTSSTRTTPSSAREACSACLCSRRSPCVNTSAKNCVRPHSSRFPGVSSVFLLHVRSASDPSLTTRCSPLGTASRWRLLRRPLECWTNRAT